jgi:hypothetical protein
MIRLEQTVKNDETPQNIWSPGRDLNPVSPEHETSTFGGCSSDVPCRTSDVSVELISFQQNCHQSHVENYFVFWSQIIVKFLVIVDVCSSILEVLQRGSNLTLKENDQIMKRYTELGRLSASL